MTIEEKIPLKQGLKHFALDEMSAYNLIEEKIPLKQGLKQQMDNGTINLSGLKRRFH